MSRTESLCGFLVQQGIAALGRVRWNRGERSQKNRNDNTIEDNSCFHEQLPFGSAFNGKGQKGESCRLAC